MFKTTSPSTHMLSWYCCESDVDCKPQLTYMVVTYGFKAHSCCHEISRSCYVHTSAPLQPLLATMTCRVYLDGPALLILQQYQMQGPTGPQVSDAVLKSHGSAPAHPDMCWASKRPSARKQHHLSTKPDSFAWICHVVLRNSCHATSQEGFGPRQMQHVTRCSPQQS